MSLLMDVQPVTADIWSLFQSNSGRMLDEYSIRKFAFLKGASEEIRPEVWQYLLGYWAPGSTTAERQSVDKSKKVQYEHIMTVVQNTLSPPDDWKIIEKDVLRTDRHTEYFKSDDSPRLHQLTRVLKAFSLHNSSIELNALTRNVKTRVAEDKKALSPVFINAQVESEHA